MKIIETDEEKWAEFPVHGQFPSGTNEDNALKYVMKRALEVTSTEIVDDDELEGVCHKLFAFEICTTCIIFLVLLSL